MNASISAELLVFYGQTINEGIEGMPVNIAIDGPAGAGKSTIAKACAFHFGYLYVDTGAMYRAVALHMLENGVDTKDREEVVRNLGHVSLKMTYINGEQHIFLNRRDVTQLIRTPEVSQGASDVAVSREVREKLVEQQRQLAGKSHCVIDGRDIGTYVLPDAQIKIFLTADVEERAKRRYEEMLEKGMKAEYHEVLQGLIERDKNDSEREFAPLRQADDAVVLDTTGNTLEESIELVRNYIADHQSL